MKRAIVAAVVPLVCAWARRYEALILRCGEPLSEEALADARRAGVCHPERVRKLVVDSVPPRLPLWLRTMANRLRWGPVTTAGMALGYGIFVREDVRENRALLIHELAHIAQYERLGFRTFLKEYLHQCVRTGYPQGELEAEARRIACDLC